jgi:hypothetical protein
MTFLELLWLFLLDDVFIVLLLVTIGEPRLDDLASGLAVLSSDFTNYSISWNLLGFSFLTEE